MKPLLIGSALLITLIALQGPFIAAQPESGPRFFGAKPGSLAFAKGRIAAGDKDLQFALSNLLIAADKALKTPAPSVTEKTKLPPSGDRHDYMSLAPYFWPDPQRPDGLPYIRKDGKVNPESKDPQLNDGPRIKTMGHSMETLALAYYFTGKEAYARHAAHFARVWFLDPATLMNPNFKYAQAVRGKNDGRGTGILEGRHIATAADSLGLLAGSKSWTADDQKAIDVWLNTYLDWLLTSNNGRDEHNAKNNHGSFYDATTTRLALCLERRDVARRIVEEAKLRRIAVQIDADGREPLELVRTTSFSYSVFNLEALCELATLGEHAGVDLWGFQTADGRSIRRAVDFLAPFVDKPGKKWPYEQIKAMNEADFLPILRQAELACKAPAYDGIITKHPDARGKRFQLLFAR